MSDIHVQSISPFEFPSGRDFTHSLDFEALGIQEKKLFDGQSHFVSLDPRLIDALRRTHPGIVSGLAPDKPVYSKPLKPSLSLEDSHKRPRRTLRPVRPAVIADEPQVDIRQATAALTDSAMGLWPSIAPYVIGSQPVNFVAESKIINGYGLPVPEVHSTRVRVIAGPLSGGYETTDTGHRRWDARLGVRSGGGGIVIDPKGSEIIRPYGRLGWLQMRVKFYKDHVSVKWESTSRSISGLGTSRELRLSRAEWVELKNVLKQNGEEAAERLIKSKYGLEIRGIKRAASLVHGAGGLIGELALFLGMGKLIDTAADAFGFDPNFKGRNVVQVGSTVAAVQGLRILKHVLDTGFMPPKVGESAVCAAGEAALTIGVFEGWGIFLDGLTSKYGLDRSHWGWTVLQGVLTFATMILGKAALNTNAENMCRQRPSPDFEEETSNAPAIGARSRVVVRQTSRPLPLIAPPRVRKPSTAANHGPIFSDPLSAGRQIFFALIPRNPR